MHRNGSITNDYRKCNLDYMPIKHQLCFTNCYAKSCSHLKNSFGIHADGEYNLNITGKIINVN